MCRRPQRPLLTGEENLNDLSPPALAEPSPLTLRDSPTPAQWPPRRDLPVAEASWPPVVKTLPGVPAAPAPSRSASAPQQVLRSPFDGDTRHPAATLTCCCHLEAPGGHLGQSLQDCCHHPLPGSRGSQVPQAAGGVPVPALALPAPGRCQTASPLGDGVRARG